MFVIFDLDGTLSDNGHRLHLIKGEQRDYDAYHRACVGDSLLEVPAQVLRTHFRCGHEVEIWTGRSDAVRAETEAWLACYHLPSGLVTRMRRAHDHQPNTDLKRSWLEEARAAGRAPDLAYEDMSDVVAMWRREGVTCFQVCDFPT